MPGGVGDQRHKGVVVGVVFRLTMLGRALRDSCAVSAQSKRVMSSSLQVVVGTELVFVEQVHFLAELRTVTFVGRFVPKISLTTSQRLSPISMESATLRAEPKIGKSLAERKERSVLGFKLLFANAPARGKVSKNVANLCVQGKLDLNSSFILYTCEKSYIYSAKFFLSPCCLLDCWPPVCTIAAGRARQ